MSKKLIGFGAGAAVVAVAGTLAYRQYGHLLQRAAASSDPAEAPEAKVLTLGTDAAPPVAQGRVLIQPVTPKQMPPKVSDLKGKPAGPAATQPVTDATQPQAPAPEQQKAAKPPATKPAVTAKPRPAPSTKPAQPKKKVISLEGAPQASGAPGAKLNDVERASLAAVQQLHALRTAVQLWQQRHGGQPVDFVANPGWEQLVRRDSTGQALDAPPTNPLNGLSRVLAVRDDPRPGQGVQGPFGYVYAVASGRLYATDHNGRVFDDGKVDAVALQVKASRELSPRDAERSVLSTLGAMRGQVALFTQQHNGTAPDFSRYPAFEQFLKPTLADGKVVDGRGGESGPVFGPYIRSMPINPLNGRYKVRAVAGEVRPGQRVESTDAGWVFSTATRRLYATDGNGCVLDDVKSNAAFIPADAGGTAPASGAPVAAVQALQEKIGQYRQQHGGRNPDLRKYPAWEQLTGKTRADGTVDPNGELGPYLFQAPVNPSNGSSAVEVVQKLTKTYRTKKPVGYVFETSTGQVHLTNEHGMLASVE